MSLSQKHTGKVLVPWFNCAEWKHVYNLIYSNTGPNWPAALEILKIWKHRTPLLSAGVEGTLILLEAMLVNTAQLSSNAISHILCTSLVRFLNLCATSGDKQGTFYKKAKENQLPKWIIGIRHDIAHSHQVPSQSVLKFSLKFCLEWLKEKYWDVQTELMTDFIVEEVSNSCDNSRSVIKDVVYVYAHVTDTEIIEHNKKVMKRVKRIVKDIENGSNIMKSVNDALKEEIYRNQEKSCDKLSTLLIDDNVMLSTECQTDEKGNKKIPEPFFNRWQNLLQIIDESKIMDSFVLRLFNFTCNESCSFSQREVASLWIKEIMNVIKGKSAEDCHNSAKTRSFAFQVLENLNPFTMNFVREVLQYNDAPSQFIEDSLSLISAFNTHTAPRSDAIFTIDDLNGSGDTFVENKINGETSLHSSARWMQIEDTSPFINLPLGILPHQDRHRSPLLSS